MKLKNLLMSILAGTAMVAGMTLVAVAPANAATWFLTKGNLDSACAWEHGGEWKAKSIAENTQGWKCYHTLNSALPLRSVNIQMFCDVKYPGTTAKWYTYSNKFDWRCTTD